MVQWKIMGLCVQFAEHLRISHGSESYCFAPCILGVMGKLVTGSNHTAPWEEKNNTCPIYNFLSVPKWKMVFKKEVITDCIIFQFNIHSDQKLRHRWKLLCCGLAPIWLCLQVVFRWVSWLILTELDRTHDYMRERVSMRTGIILNKLACGHVCGRMP